MCVTYLGEKRRREATIYRQVVFVVWLIATVLLNLAAYIMQENCH